MRDSSYLARGFFMSAVLLAVLVIGAIIFRADKDTVIRGAPANADCRQNADYSWLCIADEMRYTCVQAKDSGFLHLTLNCAPVKGCR